MSTRREFLVAGAAALAAPAARDNLPAGALAPAPLFDVRDFGATGLGVIDEHPQLNAALRAAGAAARRTGGATVRMPMGRYRVGASLLLSSGVTLELDAGATIVRTFSGGSIDNATVRNAQLAGGDNDIAVRGGAFVTDKPGFTGKHLALSNVARYRLTDIAFIGVSRDWNTQIDNCTDGVIRGLVMRSGGGLWEDGLHLNGGKRVTICDCIIVTGDDALALTTLGPRDTMSDVLVTNCYLDSGTNAIRLLVAKGARQGMRGISISSVRGRCGTAGAGNGISIENDTPDQQLLAEVALADVSIDCAQNGGAGCIVTNTRDVTLSRVGIRKPRSRPFELTGNLRLVLDECTGVDPRSPSIQCLSAASCTDLRVRGGSYRGATQHALLFARCTDTVVDGVHVNGARDSGIVFESSGGLRVVNSRVQGAGAFGLQTSATFAGMVLQANDLLENAAGGAHVEGSGWVHAAGNRGFTTSASGTATVPAKEHRVSVAHGLAAISSQSTIVVTPVGHWGDVARWWVNAITPTHFDLVVDAPPGATGLSFAWRAETWP